MALPVACRHPDLVDALAEDALAEDAVRDVAEDVGNVLDGQRQQVAASKVLVLAAAVAANQQSSSMWRMAPEGVGTMSLMLLQRAR